MEIKDLQREVIDAERLADRGRMVLDLNQQVMELKAENDRLRVELAAKGESDVD